jgi:hypothetical protein
MPARALEKYKDVTAAAGIFICCGTFGIVVNA